MPIGQYIISVKNSGFTHDQAVAFAAAHNGALAAPSTVEENNLILSFLTADDLLWHTVGSARIGPWIGLSQTPGSGEPGGGWHWDNGETMDFSQWHLSQPDNFAGDSFGIYFDVSGLQGWGDTVNDPGGAGFGSVTSVAVELGAAQEELTGSSGHDFIWGGDIANVIGGKGGNDRIYGGDGIDAIDGGGGKDTIFGGYGNDALLGGKGADQFIYQTAFDTDFFGHLYDTIWDFSHKQGDLIDLSALADDLIFLGKADFNGGHAVRYEKVDGANGWLIQVDLEGSLRPEIIIRVPDKPHLADFVL